MRRDEQRTAKAAGRRTTVPALAAAMLVATLPHAAAAYVGPGAGLTMLGALWAVIAAVLFALAGLIIWPIRAMRRRRRELAAAKAAPADGDTGA